MDYKVELASTLDIEDLINFRILMFDDMGLEYDPAEFRKRLREYFLKGLSTQQYTGWLAKTEHETIAAGGVVIDQHPPGPNNPSGKTIYIMNMSTKHEYRRKGVAKSILTNIIEWGKKQGITLFTLHATEMGKPLYESFGFKDSNEMRLRL